MKWGDFKEGVQEKLHSLLKRGGILYLPQSSTGLDLKLFKDLGKQTLDLDPWHQQRAERNTWFAWKKIELEKEEKEENMDTEDEDCDIQDLDEMTGFLWSNEDRDRESSVPDIKVIKGKEIVSYKADDYIDTELTMLNGEDAGHMQYVPNFLTDEEATCLFDHLTKGFDQETGDFIEEGESLTYDEHEVTKKKQKAVIRIGFNQERRDHRARADSGEPKIPTRSFQC